MDELAAEGGGKVRIVKYVKTKEEEEAAKFGVEEWLGLRSEVHKWTLVGLVMTWT
ncbi:unnamed protein product [Dovyalis caffra]|uniref:Uncharacterized protein n=1 Tax=Dovyalis caffra TaxID=77055 RepID=A0AAV1RAS1_9ROSI|nr:unnamed protein product [Dovyalis caffra]